MRSSLEAFCDGADFQKVVLFQMNAGPLRPMCGLNDHVQATPYRTYCRLLIDERMLDKKCQGFFGEFVEFNFVFLENFAHDHPNASSPLRKG